MKRRTKILLLLLLALILGVILLLPHGGYRRQVEAYKKQLLAQGEKLTIAELAPPTSGSDLTRAKAFMDAMKDFKYSSQDMPPAMEIIAPGVALPGQPIGVPKLSTNYEQNVIKMADLRSLLNGSTLEFHLDYSQGIHPQPLPVTGLLDMERLAAATTLQSLYAKNFLEAWADLVAAVSLIRVFEDDPLWATERVRSSCARVAMAATWESMHSGHQWSESQLAELQAKWQALDFFADSELVLAMEAAWRIQNLAEFRNASDNLVMDLVSPAEESRTDGLRRNFKNLRERVRFRRWKSSWSYDEELYYLQLNSAAMTAARRALATGAFTPVFNSLTNETAGILQLHPHAEDHFLFISPGYTIPVEYLLGHARTETARRLTYTAIALERHRLQHNTYPASLNELVPAFLPQVPTDFMDGKPLRYRLKPDGNFLLYSVGEDGKDDGGDATYTSSVKDWLQARDLVWPRAATPQELADYLKLHPPETNSLAK